MACETMIQRYTYDEFVQKCIDSGYASRRDKKKLNEWREKHFKDFYDDFDFIEAYRYLENHRIGQSLPSGKWQRAADTNGKTTKKYPYEDYGGW